MHEQCRNNLGTSQREAATHRSVKEVIQSPPESLQLFPLIYVVPQPINIECLASFQLLSVLRILNYSCKVTMDTEVQQQCN